MEIKYLIKFFDWKDKSTLIEYGVKMQTTKNLCKKSFHFELINRVQITQFDWLIS